MTVTIQRTSKRNKAQRLIAMLLIAGGGIALASGENAASTMGGIALLVGCLWFLLTIFLGWWNHG